MGVSAIRFVVRATITRTDIPALCARLADLLRGRPGDVVECDVTEVERPDVVTVEALARLRLTARRHGSRLAVTGARPDLLMLVALLGLGELLAPEEPGPATEGSVQVGRLQVGRQAEEREQPSGVQEVVDGGDPPA